MKRLITLVLVLVMALSLAAPAMAFTGTGTGDTADMPGLDIKLVDVSPGLMNVNFTAPESNRGYLKNEVVCAVVSLTVPTGLTFDTTDKLTFSGEKVSVWQNENFVAGPSTDKALKYMSTNVPSAVAHFSYNTKGDEIILSGTGLQLLDDETSDITYHFAFFAKVLDDGATMSAKYQKAASGTLVNASATGSPRPGDLVPDKSISVHPTELKNGLYRVIYVNPNIPGAAAAGSASNTDALGFTSVTDAAGFGLKGLSTDIAYLVQNAAKQPQFLIITNSSGVCKAMYVFVTGAMLEVVALEKGASEPVDAVYMTGWDRYVVFRNGVGASATNAEKLSGLAVLSSVVWGEFGLNRAIPGKLDADWWFTGGDSVSTSVEIQPWYAEVTVPPEIDIEIPKTGDAMSAVGFVLIALAGLAVVAVRKVRA